MNKENGDDLNRRISDILLAVNNDQVYTMYATDCFSRFGFSCLNIPQECVKSALLAALTKPNEKDVDLIYEKLIDELNRLTLQQKNSFCPKPVLLDKFLLGEAPIVNYSWFERPVFLRKFFGMVKNISKMCLFGNTVIPERKCDEFHALCEGAVPMSYREEYFKKAMRFIVDKTKKMHGIHLLDENQ